MAKKVKREVQEKVEATQPWELFPASGSQCHAVAKHFSVPSKSGEFYVASNAAEGQDEDVMDALKRVLNTLAAHEPNSAFTHRQANVLIQAKAGTKLDSRFVEAAEFCLKNPDIGYVEFWTTPGGKQAGYPRRQGTTDSLEIDEANVDAALSSLLKADPSPATEDDIPF